jgi:hypothetical protein
MRILTSLLVVLLLGFSSAQYTIGGGSDQTVNANPAVVTTPDTNVAATGVYATATPLPTDASFAPGSQTPVSSNNLGGNGQTIVISTPETNEAAVIAAAGPINTNPNQNTYVIPPNTPTQTVTVIQDNAADTTTVTIVDTNQTTVTVLNGTQSSGLQLILPPGVTIQAPPAPLVVQNALAGEAAANLTGSGPTGSTSAEAPNSTNSTNSTDNSTNSASNSTDNSTAAASPANSTDNSTSNSTN